MKYNDKVRVISGFYEGQGGTVYSISLDKTHSDVFYLVKLNDGTLTDYILKEYIELIK